MVDRFTTKEGNGELNDKEPGIRRIYTDFSDGGRNHKNHETHKKRGGGPGLFGKLCALRGGGGVAARRQVRRGMLRRERPPRGR